MSKLKALLLTQGMHGMVSQAEGLAKALNLNYKHQEIKLKKFWNFIDSLNIDGKSVREFVPKSFKYSKVGSAQRFFRDG